jgi:hypothetical protein
MGMELLSSRMTFFAKRISPVIWFGVILAFIVVSLVTQAWKQDPMFIVMPLAMIPIGIFVFQRLIWPLADEVRDGGAFLVVRKGGVEERVPLVSIVNVDLSQVTNPRRLTLRLRTPGKFGDEIVFLPKQSIVQVNPFARNKIAELLIKRVDAARIGVMQ